MRYVKVPKPVPLTNAAKLANGELPSLSLLELVRDTLGTRPEWRQDDTTVGMYLDLVEELEGRAPGEIVKLTDEVHEKLSAVMRTFEPAPQFALPYMRLVRVVTSAPKSIPKSAEEATPKAEADVAPNGASAEVS